jgi:uncharacterized protein (DUF427 family)
MPLTDVRVELLRPSDTVTECPYKVGFFHLIMWSCRTNCIVR